MENVFPPYSLRRTAIIFDRPASASGLTEKMPALRSIITRPLPRRRFVSPRSSCVASSPSTRDRCAPRSTPPQPRRLLFFVFKYHNIKRHLACLPFPQIRTLPGTSSYLQYLLQVLQVFCFIFLHFLYIFLPLLLLLLLLLLFLPCAVLSLYSFVHPSYVHSHRHFMVPAKRGV